MLLTDLYFGFFIDSIKVNIRVERAEGEAIRIEREAEVECIAQEQVRILSSLFGDVTNDIYC